MKNQARVVVVGGGIYGVSIAYHLARLGWTDLILLEKDEIASGATAHAAGQMTNDEIILLDVRQFRTAAVRP